MVEEKTFTEEFKVTGQQLVETVKKLIHEGNVRHVIIKNEEGKSLIEIPVTVATVGALLLPVLAALGAIAALVADCTIVVVKTEK
ncbi:MAG TPA: DUF4342 domain-containing protein [candidate division Zixibacteria bacterium]|nr:DUF4342 domain-containing protein [candidate division Zixibacteria bacterium]MDD4918367.1 DUF4342 domain-containing protein [candidate division Zixibacteria bacterium]MDM7973297.1 DUF4342 domain-containing protein [candidate division Zixibacteria bacterium]HOD66311.1 DUF4342 domain-containing protein [candidate division Zixibacteria bacterium]HPI33529.1 DUF4342 domain-containing protein [candidate division Zixibacteria bacterium]